jgi:hypothetical protein
MITRVGKANAPAEGRRPLKIWVCWPVMEIKMTDIHKLAADARPIDDADWGSARQIDAQNLFFNEVEKALPAEEFETLENFCLKASANEMVDEALRLLASK